MVENHTAVENKKLAEDQKARAQLRVEQIAGFQAELKNLGQAGLLALTPDQQRTVSDYHADLLQTLHRDFDVNLSDSARRLSLGMQVVSFLGAWALAVSVFFLFQQYWGYLATGVQVAVLVGSPLLVFSRLRRVAQPEVAQ